MLKRASLVLLPAGLLLATTPAASPMAEEGQGIGAWTAKAPLPEPKFGLHASVVDGKIHVMGGDRNVAGAVPTGSHHVYDPASDSWAMAKDMPTPRGFFGTAALDGRIYAVGGSINMQEQDPGIGTVEIYDPRTDSWTRGRTCPRPEPTSQ
jgi:N-acetylneuraminic acid mutarotase